MWTQKPSQGETLKIIEQVADNLTIPVINSQSTLATQWPTALDTVHVVTFWPAQGSASDPVQLLADWTIRFNEAWNYALRLRAELWRANTGGTVEMLFRTTFNGVQIWQTTVQKLESKNVLISLDAYVPALVGVWDLKLEIQRDSAGANDWELQQTVPTDGTWDTSASASVQVYNLNQTS